MRKRLFIYRIPQDNFMLIQSYGKIAGLSETAYHEIISSAAVEYFN